MTETLQILQQRAEKLARIEEEQQDDTGQISFVEFGLADERYAIETDYIQEVYPLGDVTTLPCVPPYVYGVINVRRRILSIVDLRKLFDLVSKDSCEKKRVIILEGENMEFAILADRIIGMRLIGIGEIQTSLPTLTGIRKDFFKGVTKDGLVILDGKKILSGKHIIVSKEST